MSNLIEVREFDSLIRESEYSNDAGFTCLNESEFDRLMDFAKEYSSTDEEADALDFVRIGYKKPYGDVITVK